MKILIGIKNVSASGSSNSSEGFGCFNITASNVTVIASGIEEELLTMVKKAREQRAKFSKEFSKLEDELDNGTFQKDYDEEYNRIANKYPLSDITEYDKLLIIEGEVL
jgi:hypothetical protein